MGWGLGPAACSWLDFYAVRASLQQLPSAFLGASGAANAPRAQHSSRQAPPRCYQSTLLGSSKNIQPDSST